MPQDSDAHYALGLALRSQDRDAEALSAYREALRHEPTDSQAMVALAAVHGSLGQYQEEVHHYSSALAFRPT